MAKSNHLSWLLLLAFICIHLDITGYSVEKTRIQDDFGLSTSRNPSDNKILRKDHSYLIARVKQVYDSQIGVLESGLNGGSEVEKYLHYVNLSKGNPWCAAFVCWVFGQAGIANPRTAWSPTLFPASKIIWSRESGTKSREPGRPPRIDYGFPPRQTTGNRQQITGNRQPDSYRLLTPGTGDVFGIYFPEKKRIAHAGFIDSWDGTWLISVEGNTNTSGNPDGDGVYRKRRPTSSIYQVARYINY